MASKPIWKGRRFAFAALALAGLASAPLAARADSIFDLFSPGVSPYEVRNNLARSGFAARSAVERRGDVYVYDVSDRYGVAQRLVIDARTGRVLERYALRPPSWAVARRPDMRAPDDGAEWGYAPRPEVDVPVARPRVIEALPVETPPEPPRGPRQRQLAYGDGHTPTPPPLSTPDTRPSDKARPRIARPKPAPSPTGSDQPQTATAAPSASDPAAPPQGGQPATTQVAPTTPQPAAAEPIAPATTGQVASSGAADAPAVKAPPPLPAPAPIAKSKAINDIPVAPLD